MTTAVLSIFVLASALLTIRAEYRGPRSWVYVCKPLTVVLVILLAFRAENAAPAAYRILIIAGLLFSLAGDVFLMLPRDRFVAGLASFLVAHLCYIAAFASDGEITLSARVGMALAAYGAVMLGRLWASLGSLKGPVACYVLVILLMTWLAVSRYALAGPAGSGPAAAGALLFAASDSLLAWDRFKGRLRAAQALVLSTYFAAQWLIALST